jgi:two-component system nitrogen regulation sensor histidine kinase NtrY
MASNKDYLHRFRSQVILRVIFLLMTMYLLFDVVNFNQGFILSPTALICFLIIQVISLIHLIEKQYKQLSLYVLSLKNNDGNQTFGSLINDPAKADFGIALHDLAEHFRISRRSLEEQALLLTTVLENTEAAMLAFDLQGKVILCNKAFKQLVFAKKIDSMDSLMNCQPLLAQHIISLGQHNSGVLPITMEGEECSLMVSVSQASIKGQKVTLVMVHNIQQALTKQEAESWQQLIRVLTHEIANSITPIASLANSAQSLLEDAENLQGEDLEDLAFSLNTIDKRSQGLLNFIDSYRDLSQLPLPHIEAVDVKNLFAQSSKLFAHQLNGVVLSIEVEPEKLIIHADKMQLEQVVINLLLNAIEALEETSAPLITLRASLTNRGRILLQVIDNGCGILEDTQQNMFLPFFTTKPQGSGIGLALSKQIINRHGGHIAVTSTVRVGTTFTITLYQ